MRALSHQSLIFDAYALDLHEVQRVAVVNPLAVCYKLIFQRIYEHCVVQHLLESISGPSFPAAAASTDRTMERLFGSDSRTLGIGAGSYVNAFVKIRHAISMQKALAATGRTFNKLPSHLFVFSSPHKTVKKGELFDVPLRMDLSFMLETSMPPCMNPPLM